MVIIKITLWTDRWILLFLQVFTSTLMIMVRVRKKSFDRKKKRRNIFLFLKFFESRSFDSPYPFLLDNFQIESDNLDNGMSIVFKLFIHCTMKKSRASYFLIDFVTCCFNKRQTNLSEPYRCKTDRVADILINLIDIDIIG